MKNFLLFFLSFVLLSSCKRDRNTTWDTEYYAPIASGELSLANVFKDSSIKTNSDNTLNLRFNKTIYELEPTTISVPDTVITSVFNLQSLIISDRTITNKVTLGQINPAFALLNGTFQNLPAQNLTDVANEKIDASDFFETAKVKTGFLDMAINNELGVEVVKVVVELRNEVDNSVVVTQVFNNIPPFGSQSHSIPLDGKTIHAALLGVIKELSTAATTSPILIDVTKGVEMVLGIRDLKPYSAIAAFPTQNIMEQDEGIVLEMGDGELKKILVKSGQMKIDFFTNVRENMTIYFKVPSLTKDGVAIEETIPVVGASPGTPVQETRIYDLAGYWMDYRGKNPEITDTVNTFHQILYVTIDSSGRKIPMSLEDSVYMYYGITDVIPEYALGYFGSSENPTGNESVIFEEFNTLKGEIELDDATVKLKVTNALGAAGLLDINSISSYNRFTKKDVVLNSIVIPNTVSVVPARANPLRPWVSEYELTKDNSNIVDFISNLPNEIRYNVNLKINPNGNTSNYKDFLYSDSKTSVSLEVDVPLKLSTTGLTMSDTVEFEYPNEEKAENVKSANLYLQIENGFPFEVEPMILLLAADGSIQDTLLASGESVAAANINNLTGDVLSSKNSTITITVPRSKLHLLKSTKNILISARIKTPDAMQGKATIRSTYSIKMKLVSDFVYEMGL
jgi:hypothetical protein